MNRYPYTIDNGMGETLTFTGVTRRPDGDRLGADGVARPGAGPPMHVHYLQDEAATVVSGRLGYLVPGGEARFANPGEEVIWPAGTPHKWWNAGNTELRIAGWCRPPDNIEFFLGALFASTRQNRGRPSLFDAAFLTTRYRSEFAMLEMPALVRRVVLPGVYLIGRLLGKYCRSAVRAGLDRRLWHGSVRGVRGQADSSGCAIECVADRQRIAVTRQVYAVGLALLVGVTTQARDQSSGTPVPEPKTDAVTQPAKIGYDDTPMQPDGRWRIHDSRRPAPPIVTPGPLVSAPPPSDAIVLLGAGQDLSAWQTDEGEPAPWPIADGVLQTGKGYIRTRAEFADIQLHVEFATPETVIGDSQDRGNSGVFLAGEFEIQVLDSFQNPTYPDGQAAAMYGQFPPMVNASRGPGQWQSYDIVFTAPRFDGSGELLAPAIVTVVHNGVVVHNARRFWGGTEHGNPVRYRNIWLRELKHAP
jgi:quercetin dioxygenase-like cupin family protein